MNEAYIDRLTKIKESLLDELQRLSRDSKELEEEHDLSVQTDHVAAIIVDFEDLLSCSIVNINQFYKGFRVEWIKSLDINQCDTLRIMELEESVQNKDLILAEYDLLLGLVDWFSEFKNNLNIIIKQRHIKNIQQIDSKRDRAIELHLISETSGSETQDEGTEDGGSRKKRSWSFTDKGATSKDKLLKSTKKLTGSLIRGNQILQSSILQSDLNLDELKLQTDMLTQMNNKYSQFETIFNKTSQLVKSLERASKQEKRDVYFSLGFLVVCISWVLWRRIFKLPVKLGIWLLFNFFKSILVSIGLVQKLTNASTTTTTEISIATNTLTSTTIQTAIKSVENAVDEAMQRIMSHDEL
ncbi:hypothetical protein Kpol_1054p7 [Vanderwaltozyma polyspora DSM 70294]|uniref:Sec20 C-terminal domain-containing protein n=1 Tax=Vanderwaltozyma polyspora (strain ATCC 22028 / DSM 70294 / BCRC 21397 / CBS 2163 / NBRC 10782 / NRRL Y-8283 / UCD 57-17) TaxID=436907 RepID=A7TI96_VANPO|nr:uncharacterized protein Kpol_1054p7 [Vanderwaltozyma polyspora DSM 70294]EDO17962.1 hypothetical protein Kpol_1054p7 [Vanderwaltozyma polyspora DSM 70294]